MIENLLSRDQSNENRRERNKVIFAGLLIRLIALTFVIFVCASFMKPYIVLDDIKYEETAKRYIEMAGSVFDRKELSHINETYIAPFWPLLVSVFAYIFKTIYIGRFINVLLSTLTIFIVYKLTFALTENHKSAMLSMRIFAYLPLSVFLCCFALKDVFISLAVMYLFYVMVLVGKNKKISMLNLSMAVLFLVCLYYSRGGVSEMMLIFFACFFMKRFLFNHKYASAICLFVVTFVVIILWGNEIIGAFETKVDDYGSNAVDTGGVAFLTMSGIVDIYKLPFSYFFASLQPIKMILFASEPSVSWLNIIAHLNVTVYPIAIANFLYIFVKKHDFLYWILSCVIYVSVINLSLGVFRHYMFLLPVTVVNASVFIAEQKKRLPKEILITGTLALLALMLGYSLLTTIR